MTEESRNGDDAPSNAAQYQLPPRLHRGCQPLERAIIKDFLRFYATLGEGNGRIDNEQLTINTMCTTAEWFFAGFFRVTGNDHGKEARHEIYEVSSLDGYE